MKNKILFIGTGAWGSAIASLLATNSNNEVKMWGINSHEVDSLNKGKNPDYFKNISLSKKIYATKILDDVIKNNDYIFLAIPSKVLKETTRKIIKKIDNSPIFVNLAKGLDEETNDIWSKSLKKLIDNCTGQYATLSGPSFAIDLVKKKPTMVNVVSADIEVAKKVSNIFINSLYFKAIPLNDEIGVEMCGALKNLLAIGTGIAQENHSSINTISAVLTQGIKEIKKIILLKGGKESTILSLAGIGDMFLTCTSKQSRNFSFGKDLHRKNFKIIKKMKLTTIEGYTVYPIVSSIIKNNNLNSPVLESICEVLSQSLDPKEFVKSVIFKMGLLERKKND